MKPLYGLTLFTIIFLTINSVSYSAPRLDYDIDNDGLIEINDLQDLNEIRNNFTAVNYLNEHKAITKLEILGNTLYNSQDGCPSAGCGGYELTQDLNFDSNKNNQFDDGDIYWNKGKGWQPIGNLHVKFTCEFNGNNYTLHNLNIHRPFTSFAGLFAHAELAYIHDLSLTAHLVISSYSGALLGQAWKSKVENIKANVYIQGATPYRLCNKNCQGSYIGGIIGLSDHSSFKKMVIKSQVFGHESLGGLAGDIKGGQFNEIAIQSVINGKNNLGGVAGKVHSSTMESIVSITQVKGHNLMGGLAGSSQYANFNNVLVSGSVTENTHTLGFRNKNKLVGMQSKGEITHVVNLIEQVKPIDRKPLTIDLIHETHPLLTYTQIQPIKGKAHLINQTFSPTKEFNVDTSQQQPSLLFNTKNTQHAPLWIFESNQQAPIMNLSMGQFGDANVDGLADSWPIIKGPAVKNLKLQEAVMIHHSGLGTLGYPLLCLVALTTRRYFATHVG